jgi:hypothetical protein
MESQIGGPQEVGDFGVSARFGGAQRRQTVLIGRIHIGALRQQHRDGLRMCVAVPGP